MDFPYLAKVAAINAATIRGLASAPAAPAAVMLRGALGSDTTVTWTTVSGAASYRTYWRRADEQQWTDTIAVAGGPAQEDFVKGDRKSVVKGTRVSVRVDIGGRCIIKKQQ